MAFLSIPNIQIKGIASSVPKRRQPVTDCECLTPEEANKLSALTGIYERRLADANIGTSDLCVAAADKLLDELGWNRASVDALIFVTQTPDYTIPSTAPLLQQRLSLSPGCLAFDISLGCSGYIYGLATLASLMTLGSVKKALLLVGDTVSKICAKTDKSTYPLFGDAGSATALVYNLDAKPIFANLCTDGSGYDAIMVKDGGARNPVNNASFDVETTEDGIQRNATQLILNGMDVFSFGISKGPAVVKDLLSNFNLDINIIDHFIFHQANKMMNEKIRKKLGIDIDKVPYSLEQFGNTSCATIPLTITTQLRDKINSKSVNLLLCGFGVGLSWGAVYLPHADITCLPLIEI